MRAVGEQLCKDYRGGVRSFSSPVQCMTENHRACTFPYSVDPTRLPRFADIAMRAGGGVPCIQLPDGPCPRKPFVRLEVHAPRIMGDSATVKVETFLAEDRDEKGFASNDYLYVVRRTSPFAWMVSSRHFTRHADYEIP